MSPRRPPPELPPVPPIKRVKGLRKVRGLALKLIQQQLESLKDRHITRDEREFLLGAYKVLSAPAKPAVTTPKPGAGGPGDDPLKILGD